MSRPANSVIILGAFGRADDFAVELQRAGFAVTLLDCTEFLGQGQNLGVGPFPLVSGATSLEASLKEHELKRGLTFWMPEGPLELSGPMAEFHKTYSPAIQFLSENGASRRRREFSVEWLSQFMHQFASPWMSDSTKASLTGALFPFNEKLVVLNNFTFLKGLKKACADEGVRRFMVKSWLGLEMNGGRIEELKFVTDAGEVALSAPSVVWTLSSWESQKLNSELSKKIFGTRILDPDWQWVRFDMRSIVGSWIGGIPYWTVVMQDFYLPWTHANAFIMLKGSSGNWDVWLKVPFNRLSDPAAWHTWARGVESVLQKRLPHGQWICDEASLKTCPQGMAFDSERASSWRPPSLSGFHYCAHEVLPRLDFACWYDTLDKFLPALTETKNREMRKAKGGQSDHAVHAP